MELDDLLNQAKLEAQRQSRANADREHLVEAGKRFALEHFQRLCTDFAERATALSLPTSEVGYWEKRKLIRRGDYQWRSLGRRAWAPGGDYSILEDGRPFWGRRVGVGHGAPDSWVAVNFGYKSAGYGEYLSVITPAVEIHFITDFNVVAQLPRPGSEAAQTTYLAEIAAFVDGVVGSGLVRMLLR